MENTTDNATQPTIEQLIEERAQLVTKLAYQMEQKQSYQDNYWKASSEISKLRNIVREYFKSELDGDKNGTVEMDLDAINQLLVDIGGAELKFTYSARVTISFVIDGIEADSEEEAEQIIADSINYSVQTDYESMYDEEVEITEVEAE
jgi:hypothetical protein